MKPNKITICVVFLILLFPFYSNSQVEIQGDFQAKYYYTTNPEERFAVPGQIDYSKCNRQISYETHNGLVYVFLDKKIVYRQKTPSDFKTIKEGEDILYRFSAEDAKGFVHTIIIVVDQSLSARTGDWMISWVEKQMF